MGARFRSWWKQIKAHPVTSILISLSFAIFVLFLIGGYKFNWAWTGFNGTDKTDKTLYDWMQLLFIPVVLAIAGFWFNHRERKAAELRAENEQKAAKFRAWNEQKAAEFRAEAEREIERQHAKTERDIAEDNQREAVLQEYINEMSELLLHENLRKSGPEDEVRKIARVRTMTVLPRLDGKRKGTVLQFLHESEVIKQGKYSYYLSGADLSGADLSRANLIGVNLNRVNLNRANLTRAFLGGANLSEADLTEVNLNGANLLGANLLAAYMTGADLTEANLKATDLAGVDLVGANLTRANLIETNLIQANLTEANLKDATGITTEELEKQTKTLKGATMPDGSIHA